LSFACCDTRRDNPEWYQARLPNAAGVPLGRQGSVDDIAATCLFLSRVEGDRLRGRERYFPSRRRSAAVYGRGPHTASATHNLACVSQ